VAVQRADAGGAIGNDDHDDAIRIIHKALDAGVNFVDTADAYGDSEVVVGKALKGRRDSVVLATKVGRPLGDDPNRQGASRRWIMTAVERSLRRLQTDYIDLYRCRDARPGVRAAGARASEPAPATGRGARRRIALSAVLDRGQEVVERATGSYGVAGGVEVHEQAADDGEHDGRQLGPAEAAQALLERREPVSGRGLPEAWPERFARGVVEPAEHAQVGPAVRSGHRRPGVAQGRRVGLLGAQAQEGGERLELALSRLPEDLPEQAVAGLEVVDQHPARGSSGGRQRPEPVG
jgi:hypothetical protein